MARKKKDKATSPESIKEPESNAEGGNVAAIEPSPATEVATEAAPEPASEAAPEAAPEAILDTAVTAPPAENGTETPQKVVDGAPAEAKSAQASAPIHAVKAPATAMPRPALTAKSFLTSLWWLPVSFGLPFLCVWLLTHNCKPDERLFLSMRSASVGLSVAFIIFVLASVDRLLTGSDRLPKVKDLNADILTKALAMVLWLVWMGAGHIMVLATDEIQAELPPAITPAN